MDQKKIGCFLKELRKEKGITQKQLAAKLGVSGRTVSRWETGSNMPDISLLVEIADFYGIDVRELIEGEKKSEMMNENIREVANKMADYADNEKSKILKYVRIVGIVGVALLTFAIILQSLNFSATAFSTFALMTSFAALIAMVILTLHVNGLLQKIVKNKHAERLVKFGLFAMLIIAVRFIFAALLMFGIIAFEFINPFKTVEGLENYSRTAYTEKYGNDLNSELLIFPTDASGISEGTFESSLKTGLFDTDGYIILKAKYSPDDYDAEVKRISGIKADGERLFQDVLYDENMYKYPAYIASDGCDSVYEYALLDEPNDQIIYVFLSYPTLKEHTRFKDYCKKNFSSYNADRLKKGEEKFTIYYDHER
ncbi:MAG: helix-turn-helix domain-containing protein [Butyrivibrio sp.]|nr:helix-turn-helix domain-containing protein [Butyrivibrio sp.]